MTRPIIFRNDRAGIAHVVFPGTISARCGALAKGDKVTVGVPCAHCLAVVTPEQSA